MPALATANRNSLRAPRAHLFGVSAALVTPFAKDGSVDLALTAAHASRVIEQGADGITLFGTTGEGASLGLDERRAMIDAVAKAGIDPLRITVCVAACDLQTALSQAKAAFEHGVRRLLLCPPFYFKGIDEGALYEWVSNFIELTSSEQPQIILYHIPQVTAVRFDVPLINRLKKAHGETIFGIKDSEGSWSNSEKLLSLPDLAVLIGDERLLARAAPLGGAGAISGMANLLPAQLGKIIREGEDNPGLSALVDEIVKAPVTPLVKALVGAVTGDSDWHRTRPPLSPANIEMANRLAISVKALQT